MRLHVLILFCCLASEAGVCQSEETKLVARQDQVFMIYTEAHGLTDSGESTLILAIRKDGQTVWSENRTNGGGRYRIGQIEPKKIEALLARLKQDGLFSDKDLLRSHFGPDASFTTILVESGKQKLKMSSWHELAEADGGIATERGLGGPKDSHRLAVLKESSPKYLHYRLVWSELRSQLSDLLPAESRPLTEGHIEMKAGEVYWVLEK